MKKYLILVVILFLSISLTGKSFMDKVTYFSKSGEDEKAAKLQAMKRLKNKLSENVKEVLKTELESKTDVSQIDTLRLNSEQQKIMGESLDNLRIMRKSWDGITYTLKGYIRIDIKKMVEVSSFRKISYNEKMKKVLSRTKKWQQDSNLFLQSLSTSKLEEKYVSAKNQNKAQKEFEQAQLMTSLKRYDEAINHYEKCLEYDPYKENANYNLGILYFQNSRYLDAIKAFKKELELNDKHEKAYYNLGISYIEITNYKKAVKSLKQALEIKSDYPKALYSLGFAYINLQEYEKAISALKKAVSLNAEFSAAYYSLGFANSAQENYEQAINYYEKAIKYDKDYVEAYIELGLAYYFNKNYDNAIDAFKKALDLDADEEIIYINLAKSYEKKGEKPQSLEYYQKAANLGNKDAQDYLDSEGIAW